MSYAPGAPAAVWACIEQGEARPNTCTARPWPSCSRPDGTPLYHWKRGYVWRDRGEGCL